MAWTYSGNPASSSRDEIRFLIGDTDSTSQQLSDEEIDYLATTNPDRGALYPNLAAASSAAGALAARYAKLIDKTVGSLSLSYSQKFDHYTALATRLATEAAGPSSRQPGVPVLGGGGRTYLAGTWP